MLDLLYLLGYGDDLVSRLQKSAPVDGVCIHPDYGLPAASRSRGPAAFPEVGAANKREFR